MTTWRRQVAAGAGLSAARRALDGSVSEKDFMAAVVELAHLRGWMTYHTFDARRSAPGFPDLICVRDGRQLAIECKSERGSLTVDQERWLDALGAVAGVDAYCWRPSDWAQIEEVLR